MKKGMNITRYYWGMRGFAAIKEGEFMIGFEIEATGSNGFKHTSGAWTEGSLIALKVLLRTTNFTGPSKGPTGVNGVRSKALTNYV